MSNTGITDTGNVPGVTANITSMEEIVHTDTGPENIDTGDVGAGNTDTEGNTSITHTPGASRGGNLSPQAFDTLIRDITPQPGENTERRSGVHSRGGTSVPRYSRGDGNRHFYPT